MTGWACLEREGVGGEEEMMAMTGRDNGLLENMAWRHTKLLVHHGMHIARCNEWLLRQAGKKKLQLISRPLYLQLHKKVKYSCLGDKIITHLMIYM